VFRVMRRYARPHVIEGLAGRSRKDEARRARSLSPDAGRLVWGRLLENSTATPTGGLWPKADAKPARDASQQSLPRQELRGRESHGDEQQSYNK